ncbi:MAG TPA: DUF86 domain-containing protein [Longimicrobium sp.]|nr:DUF86 domain-containing protein [Longimicrobium sp.]
MSFSPLEYLRHMLVEADFLIEQTRFRAREDVLADEVLRRALVRSVEVIGEAAKQVPADFRNQHPQIEWKLMAGMRDRLIHGYFGIDYNIVWNVATEEAATLKQQIEDILSSHPSGGE